MAYSVLILDDDSDFNSLLTDIFEQADYTVTPMEDPVEAVVVFRDNHFDLVVTDHKMPRMSGAEYMKVIKQIKPEVPVIMVSGYLENDTIRELISDGVGGVFLKPLNIFSLLERTAELIVEAKKYQDNGGERALLNAGAKQSTLKFPFRSFPCKASASIRFAERLYALRNFKSTLSLVGPNGANYRAICDDIRSFDASSTESFIYLSPESFDESHAISAILNAQKANADQVTCVVLGVESLSLSQKKLAAQLARCEGVFDNGDLVLRTIFCVSGDLDELFDEGRIDESLYILMGTAEIKVPSLNECSHDVPVLAQQLLLSISAEQGREVVPELSQSAAEMLLSYDLERDYDQLHSAIQSIVVAGAKAELSADVLRGALENACSMSPHAALVAFLEAQRVDYAKAVYALNQGDLAKTADFLRADTKTLEEIVKQA
ncbi:MAG TPA: hypothetical protein DCX06_02375 [Opitutae bacterium]|nr:hypothetical protein [Opitutae bacterium]